MALLTLMAVEDFRFYIDRNPRRSGAYLRVEGNR
jgi:hypothetical protein